MCHICNWLKSLKERSGKLDITSVELCTIGSISNEYHKMEVNVKALISWMFSQKAMSKMLEMVMNCLLRNILESYLRINILPYYPEPHSFIDLILIWNTLADFIH